MIDIMLLEPENPGNIGAVARVIKNFGFRKLVLIEPKASKKDESAKKRAKWANDVLEKSIIRKKSFLKKYDLLIGTSSKVAGDYNLSRTPLSPEQLAEKLPRSSKRRIGLLFGRESSGLTNEELKQCDILVTIPSDDKYPVLNISHAAGIICYELFKAEHFPLERRFPIATRKEKRILEKYVKEKVIEHDSTESQKETIMKSFHNLFGKSMITKREAFALMGFFRKKKGIRKEN